MTFLFQDVKQIAHHEGTAFELNTIQHLDAMARATEYLTKLDMTLLSGLPEEEIWSFEGINTFPVTDKKGRAAEPVCGNAICYEGYVILVLNHYCFCCPQRAVTEVVWTMLWKLCCILFAFHKR
eukprot:g7140.t1